MPRQIQNVHIAKIPKIVYFLLFGEELSEQCSKIMQSPLDEALAYLRTISAQNAELAPTVFSSADKMKYFLCIGYANPDISDDQIEEIGLNQLSMNTIALEATYFFLGRASLLRKLFENNTPSVILGPRIHDNFDMSASMGHTEMLKLLVEKFIGNFNDFIENVYFSPFYRAAKAGHLDTLRYIVSLAPDKIQYMIAIRNYCAFRWALKKGKISVVRYLIELAPEQKEAMITASYNDMPHGLKLSAINGQIDSIDYLLELVPDKQIAMVGSDNYVVFRIAAKNVAEYLISKFPNEAKAMLAANDFEVFASAASRGDLDYLRYLTSKAGSLECVPSENSVFNAIICAIDNGQKETLEFMVNTYKDQVSNIFSNKDKSKKIFSIATTGKKQRLDVIKHLADETSCFSANNFFGPEHLLHDHIASCSNISVIDFLLKKYDIDINTQDGHGNTLLHKALTHTKDSVRNEQNSPQKRGFCLIIFILYFSQKKANRNIQNNAGETALNILENLHEKNLISIYESILSIVHSAIEGNLTAILSCSTEQLSEDRIKADESDSTNNYLSIYKQQLSEILLSLNQLLTKVKNTRKIDIKDWFEFCDKHKLYIIGQQYAEEACALASSGKVERAITLAESLKSINHYLPLYYLGEHLLHLAKSTSKSTNEKAYKVLTLVDKSSPYFNEAQFHCYNLLLHADTDDTNKLQILEMQFTHAVNMKNQTLVDDLYHRLCGYNLPQKKQTNVKGDVQVLIQKAREIRKTHESTTAGDISFFNANKDKDLDSESASANAAAHNEKDKSAQTVVPKC